MGRNILYWNPVIGQLEHLSEVIIYGAGVMGKALKTCLTEEPYNLHITCFLVEDTASNPHYVDDIRVIGIRNAGQYKDSLVLVGLHEKHIGRAIENLSREGFTNILPVTFDGDVWSDIRGNWFRHKRLSAHRVYNDVESVLGSKVHVYVVHSEFDKKLKSAERLRDYEIPLQAGAALTDERMCLIRDNQGENISEKNRQYCELTALYWIWKNDASEYAGLCHYRRRFAVSNEQMSKLAQSDVDVMVTVPVLNFPNVRQQYAMDHSGKDWDILLEAIDALCPAYKERMESVQNGNYYYAYNMFIARKEILEKYCEWLFPILQFCEEKIGSKSDSYQNRYIGFLAERLLTVFLEYHKEYKVVISRKHFLESET